MGGDPWECGCPETMKKTHHLCHVAVGSGRERRTPGCNTGEPISDLDASIFTGELRMKLLNEFSCLAGP